MLPILIGLNPDPAATEDLVCATEVESVTSWTTNGSRRERAAQSYICCPAREFKECHWTAPVMGSGRYPARALW